MVEVAHFRGNVIDAQTRQPIAEFTVSIGSNTEDDPKPFFNPLPVFRNGQYDYTARGMLVSRTAWFVRVESKGYAPVQSGPLPLGGLSVTDFELKKAADLTGRIVDADGNPVAGADVILALGRDKVRIKNGRVDMRAYYTSQKRLVVSDAEGRYTFPPQSGNYVVMALGDGGYARADDGALMDSTEIKLKPWGKLAGRAVYHKEAAEGAVIEAEPVSERYPHPDQEWTYTTVADDAGKYFFDRVPAGIVEVTMRIIKPNVDKQTVDGFLESGPATIAAGETVTLELGNDEPGRTFMGRGLIPSQIPGPGKRDLLGDLDLKDKVGDPPMPPGVAGGSAQAQRKWWDDFLLTDDGQTYALMSSYHRRYDVDMDDDGRFKVEGVAPGTYRLTLDAMPRNGIERNGRYDFAHLSMGILMNAKNSKGTTDPFVLPDQELSPDWYLVPAKPAR
jgi:protocatechuate 3,4-dioxygenase beta subunit